MVIDVGYAQKPNEHLIGKIYGIDLVSAPTPQNYVETKVCDLNVDLLPFPDAFADTITMGCVLAHVGSPLKVLAEANRVLKENGVLIVTSPNPNYYWETVLNVFYHFFKKRVSRAKHEEHFFEFSRYNMRTSAARTGFEVVGEVGCRFHLVKTPFKFHPIRFPGFAYEIAYVLKKNGTPSAHATFENAKGDIERIPAQLF